MYASLYVSLSFITWVDSVMIIYSAVIDHT